MLIGRYSWGRSFVVPGENCCFVPTRPKLANGPFLQHESVQNPGVNKKTKPLAFDLRLSPSPSSLRWRSSEFIGANRNWRALPRVGLTAMKMGYARVSTDDQNLGLQHDALRVAGCDQIYDDQGVSGAVIERDGLSRALAEVGTGDVLVVGNLTASAVRSGS